MSQPFSNLDLLAQVATEQSVNNVNNDKLKQLRIIKEVAKRHFGSKIKNQKYLKFVNEEIDKAKPGLKNADQDIYKTALGALNLIASRNNPVPNKKYGPLTVLNSKITYSEYKRNLISELSRRGWHARAESFAAKPEEKKIVEESRDQWIKALFQTLELSKEPNKEKRFKDVFEKLLKRETSEGKSLMREAYLFHRKQFLDAKEKRTSLKRALEEMQKAKDEMSKRTSGIQKVLTDFLEQANKKPLREKEERERGESNVD